jgi:Spy/CpxP family protein refolding chaperone
MAKVLDLTPDQQAAMKDAMVESKKAMSAWMKGEEGQKLKELMTQLKEAKKAGQTDDVKGLMAEVKELSKARQQIMAGAKAAVMDVLTDEQKAKWKEYIASKKKGGPKKDGDAPKKGGKKPRGGKKNKGGEQPAPE